MRPDRTFLSGRFRATGGWHAVAAVLAFLAFTSVLPARAAGPGEPRTNINPALVIHTAFLTVPELDASDHDHVFTNDWRGRAYDARFEDLIARYDGAFRELEKAARQQAPCDWGYDFSEGPAMLLPHLARSKSMAVATRLRFRWHCEHARPQVACDEWLAAFHLARQASRGGVLIGVLVQIAMENILVTTVAENWHRLDDATLRQLAAGMEAAPPRVRVRECLESERSAFRDWFVRQLDDAKAVGGSEAEVMARARKMLADLEPESDGREADDVIRAAGGTFDGLVRAFRELDAFYDEAAVLLAAESKDFVALAPRFQEKLERHPNPLARTFFAALPGCRSKELAVQSRLAMLPAAVAYRLGGEARLQTVADPALGEPFAFRRFVFDGVDRGFELRSKVVVRDVPEVQIFVEKEGPPFQLQGPFVGQAVR